MREYITKKIIGGMLFALGFFGTTILAVAISGTIKTWTTGEVLKSSDLNTTITSLKTAIEGIPNWTKAANGNDAYYTAGNVGIGTSNPSSGALEVIGTKNNIGTYDNGVLNIYDNNVVSANNGASISFLGKYTGSSYTQYAAISAYKLNATDADFSAGLKFNTRNNSSNPATAMTINNLGNVGIGTTTPSQTLTVNGNAGNTTGVWVNNSDERLKKNIQPLGNYLEKLTELRPVTFEWKDPKKLNAKEGNHIGFIAQEVEKVFPYWVDTDKDGMKWLSMEGVNAAFVQSFKEVALRLRSLTDLQQAEKAVNEKKLLALEEDNKRLRETVETLRASVETHSRASLRLEDRLRAIENMQMARK